MTTEISSADRVSFEVRLIFKNARAIDLDKMADITRNSMLDLLHISRNVVCHVFVSFRSDYRQNTATNGSKQPTLCRVKLLRVRVACRLRKSQGKRIPGSNSDFESLLVFFR